MNERTLERRRIDVYYFNAIGYHPLPFFRSVLLWLCKSGNKGNIPSVNRGREFIRLPPTHLYITNWTNERRGWIQSNQIKSKSKSKSNNNHNHNHNQIQKEDTIGSDRIDEHTFSFHLCNQEHTTHVRTYGHAYMIVFLFIQCIYIYIYMYTHTHPQHNQHNQLHKVLPSPSISIKDRAMYVCMHVAKHIYAGRRIRSDRYVCMYITIQYNTIQSVKRRERANILIQIKIMVVFLCNTIHTTTKHNNKPIHTTTTTTTTQHIKTIIIHI